MCRDLWNWQSRNPYGYLDDHDAGIYAREVEITDDDEASPTLSPASPSIALEDDEDFDGMKHHRHERCHLTIDASKRPLVKEVKYAVDAVQATLPAMF